MEGLTSKGILDGVPTVMTVNWVTRHYQIECFHGSKREWKSAATCRLCLEMDVRFVDSNYYNFLIFCFEGVQNCT